MFKCDGEINANSMRFKIFTKTYIVTYGLMDKNIRFEAVYMADVFRWDGKEFHRRAPWYRLVRTPYNSLLTLGWSRSIPPRKLYIFSIFESFEDYISKPRYVIEW